MVTSARFVIFVFVSTHNNTPITTSILFIVNGSHFLLNLCSCRHPNLLSTVDDSLTTCLHLDLPVQEPLPFEVPAKPPPMLLQTVMKGDVLPSRTAHSHVSGFQVLQKC
jgi:hypothetical protein